MSDSCEDCRRLRHERSRHLVLILALVDFLKAAKEAIGALDGTVFGGTTRATEFRRLVSRASRLVGLCENELTEAQKERHRRAESHHAAALVQPTGLRVQDGDPGGDARRTRRPPRREMRTGSRCPLLAPWSPR